LGKELAPFIIRKPENPWCGQNPKLFDGDLIAKVAQNWVWKINLILMWLF
jgi:hypothetical protein